MKANRLDPGGSVVSLSCLFVYLFWVFEAGFLCALAVLKLSVDQASLEPIEIRLLLPPQCQD